MSHLYTEDLNALVAALLAKGYVEAHADLILRSDESYAPFGLDLDYKVRADATRSFRSIRYHTLATELGRSPTVGDLLAAGRALIAELPSQREQEIKDFVNQMEELKKSAESLGIEGDFVNPLLAIMEKLASNALPAPKG